MSESKIPIYNPDIDDFSVQYTTVEEGQKTYTIRAMEIKYFKPVIARHIAKHLANHLLHKRGIKHNAELDLENIKKEIMVKI